MNSIYILKHQHSHHGSSEMLQDQYEFGVHFLTCIYTIHIHTIHIYYTFIAHRVHSMHNSYFTDSNFHFLSFLCFNVMFWLRQSLVMNIVLTTLGSLWKWDSPATHVLVTGFATSSGNQYLFVPSFFHLYPSECVHWGDRKFIGIKVKPRVSYRQTLIVSLILSTYCA